MPDFQLTALTDVKIILDRMFPKNRVKHDNGSIMPESFNAIAENQNINVSQLTEAEKGCIGFKAYWTKPSCGDAECADQPIDLCDFAADETMEFEEQEFTVNGICWDKFQLNADICESGNMIKFADRFSYQMGEVFKRFEKKMNSFAIGFLNANIDDNEVVSGPMTNTPGVGTIIPPTNWTAALMGNLQQVSFLNKIEKPIILNGNNLWVEIWNANMGKCCTDQGDASKFNSFKNVYWDTFGLDQQLSEKPTFLWDAGSLAVMNQYYYENSAPREVTADKVVYSVAHPTLKYFADGMLKPMMIDVVRLRKCNTSSKGTLVADYTWAFSLRYEFLKSPVGCNGKLPLFKFLNQ